MTSINPPPEQLLLHMLRGKSLHDLHEWPQQLKKSSEVVEHKLAELACEEYNSLISIDNLCRQVGEDLSQLSSIASQLSTQSCEELKLTSESFETAVSGMVGSAAVAENKGGLLHEASGCRRVLKTYSKLSALLEVHRVMDGLIRGKHYEEAMELQQYINRLRMRFPKMELLAQISERTKASSKRMIKQLVEELQDNIALHNSIRIIGYLRRSQSFSEEELRLAFLNGRYQYFRSQLDAALSAVTTETRNESGSFMYAKSLLDCARALFVDVFTQYQAIFLDSHSKFGNLNTKFDHEPHSLPNSILFSFMTHVSDEFLAEFAQAVQEIFDISLLSNLLTQSMHFGIALSRKGMDLRYQLNASIRQRVSVLFAEQLNRSTSNFLNELQLNGMKSMINTRITQNSIKSGPTSAGGSIQQPPTVLLDYPPLAALLNANLQVLNMFRIIPAVELSSELSRIFVRNHQTLAESLVSYRRQTEVSAVSDDEDRAKEQLAASEVFRVFAGVYTPFIFRCLKEGLHANHSILESLQTSLV